MSRCARRDTWVALFLAFWLVMSDTILGHTHCYDSRSHLTRQRGGATRRGGELAAEVAREWQAAVR
jgi:hypothetical protein